ncbi:MAG: contact-dependent growth inhibition system immunity protein [Verrucomicrobiales bacterium]
MFFDRNKSLIQLKREKFEDKYWDFQPFASGYWLRKLPLSELTDRDIWILIRQGIGLDYLVLIAIEKLEVNPLIRAQHSEGDLLSAVLWADALVWKRHPDYRERVIRMWGKISARLMNQGAPHLRMLFSDYRWFLKADKMLPK